MADTLLGKGVIQVEAQGVEKASAAIDALEKDIYEFADVYEVAGKEVDKFDQFVDELVADLEALKTKQNQTATSATEAGKAFGHMGAGIRGANVGQAALEASRALEDLQYGVSGVVNNIPSLVLALGGGAGLTAAISLVAVGINQLVKHWPEFMGLFTERNPVPQATDTLVRYKNELEETTKKLDGYKSMASLSNTELAKFNELTERELQLKKQINEEEEKRQKLKHVLDSKSQEDRQRAQAFSEASAGRGEQLRKDIAAAYAKEGEYAIAEFKRAMDDRLQKLAKSGATNTELIKAAEEETKAFERYKEVQREGSKRLAEDLLVQLSEGQAFAVQKLRRLMDAGTGVLIGGNGFRAKFEAGQPEVIAARKAETDMLNRQGEENEVIGKQQKDAQDRREKKLTDALNTQGAEGEALALKQLREMQGGEKVRKDMEKAAITRQLAAEDASIKGGGYDLFAQQHLARLRAQGGEFDARGRLHKMTEDQMFDLVQRRVDAALKQRNPFMMGDARRDIATRATSMARGDLDQKLTAMSGQNLTNTQKLIAVGSELGAQIARLQGVAAQQGREIDGLLRDTRSRSRTALKR